MAASSPVEIKCVGCGDSHKGKIQHVFDGHPSVHAYSTLYRMRLLHGAVFNWPTCLQEDKTWSKSKGFVQDNRKKTVKIDDVVYSNERLSSAYSWTFDVRRVETCTGQMYVNMQINVHNAYLYDEYWFRYATFIVDARCPDGSYKRIYDGRLKLLRFNGGAHSHTIKNIALASDILDEQGQTSFRIAVIAQVLYQDLK